jgi:hypothetical protein
MTISTGSFPKTLYGSKKMKKTKKAPVKKGAKKGRGKC